MDMILNLTLFAIYTYAIWRHGWSRGRRTTLARLSGRTLRNWWER